MPGTFRALRHRNFRLLWLGLLVSLTGRWMQSVAQGWLVLRLTDSAFSLGLIAFCGFLPTLLFALPAGVAADRLPRRTTLLWVQGIAMALAAALTAVTWLGIVRPWQIAALAFAGGVVGTLDVPVRQSLLLDLVGRDDLPNAIALNSLAFNASRFVGPLVAGLLIAAAGEAPVFLLTAVGYVAILFSVVRMRLPAPAGGRPRASWIEEIRAGLAYAAAEPQSRRLLGLVVVAGVFGLPYSVLLPVFARDILGVGSRGLGLLVSATGLGAVTGALVVASRRGQPRAGRTVAVALALAGIALAGFAVCRVFWLSLLLLFLVGMALLVQMASSNTVLQVLAPEALRGRVISLYMLALMGMAPIGSLAAGTVARWAGAPAAVAGGGVVCVAAAFWYAMRLRENVPLPGTFEAPRRNS